MKITEVSVNSDVGASKQKVGYVCDNSTHTVGQARGFTYCKLLQLGLLRNLHNHTAQRWWEGEGGREGVGRKGVGRKGGREGGREGEWEGGREVGREGDREGRGGDREVRREVGEMTHLWGTCTCNYSGTSLIQTPSGQKKVSLLVRCPDLSSCHAHKQECS